MAVHSARNSFTRPSPQVTKSIRIPAPVKGIDARTSLANGDPLTCLYSFNILPSEYGMRVRKGYREWCIDISNGNPLAVGTIIPFGGVDDDVSDDRLFAVTNEGIWDVTLEDTPVLLLDFLDAGNGGNTGPDVGYGVYTQYTTDADEQLLFYADSINGLFQYSEITDLWIRTPDFTYAGGTPPIIENIVYVTSHKKQIWFIERDKSNAWYLPQAAITGEVTPFFFGSKFKHGGNLAGLFSWTIDGGEGVDDYLVAVSRAGDVLPYLGTDPSSADNWSSKGQYFIGAVPKGNRFSTEHGGNLLLLSAFGIISMDELIRGVDGKDVNAQTVTLQIADVIRTAMELQRLDRGWMIRYMPSIGAMVVRQPKRLDGQQREYVMNVTTSGWGIWRDAPINCFDEWGGVVYFGTEDGKVMKMDSPIDNTKITPDVVGELNGVPIEFSILTIYQDFGEPSVFKRGKYVRSDFLAATKPSVTTKFLYEYNIGEITANNASVFGLGSRWDADNWDAALWGVGIARGFNTLSGGWGMGRNVAIAMRGNSSTETTLIAWDVLWDSGAPL